MPLSGKVGESIDVWPSYPLSHLNLSITVPPVIAARMDPHQRAPSSRPPPNRTTLAINTIGRFALSTNPHAANSQNMTGSAMTHDPVSRVLRSIGSARTGYGRVRPRSGGSQRKGTAPSRVTTDSVFLDNVRLIGTWFAVVPYVGLIFLYFFVFLGVSVRFSVHY